MPIGKNAIKRVENNGYSKVKSEAPDMENSTEFPLTPKPMKKKTTVKKTSVPKSDAAKKPSTVQSKAKATAKADADSATDAKTVAASTVIAKPEVATDKTLVSERGGGGYINFGRDLPIYLL